MLIFKGRNLVGMPDVCLGQLSGELSGELLAKLLPQLKVFLAISLPPLGQLLDFSDVSFASLRQFARQLCHLCIELRLQIVKPLFPSFLRLLSGFLRLAKVLLPGCLCFLLKLCDGFIVVLLGFLTLALPVSLGLRELVLMGLELVP